MASLTGQSIASSYEQLLSLPDGGGNTTTLVAVTDGDAGTTFAMQLSTTTVCIDNPTADSSTQGGILRLQSDDGALMQSGSRLGVIEFAGAEDSSSTITVGARIESVTDAAWSATENGADMVFYTTDGNASQSEVMRLTADNLVGIGTSSPSGALTVQNGSIALVIGADVNGTTLSDNTRKYLRFGMPHYHTAEEPITFITGDSDGTDNIVAIGGMSTTTNAATQLRFYTAANDATTTGTERMRIDSSGNVGIGTTPDANTPLHIKHATYGRMRLESTGTDTYAICYYKNDAVEWYTGINGSDQFAIYDNTNSANRLILDTNSRISLSNNDGNTSNTVFGYKAFTNNGTVLGNVGADYNTVVGDLAMGVGVTTTAEYNTALGYATLEDLTTGDNNVAVGAGACRQLTEVLNNVAISTNALYTATTQDECIAIGRDALYALNDDAADGSIGIGHFALKALTTGTGNLAIGYLALQGHTTGHRNIAIGYGTMRDTDHHADVQGSIDNTFIGFQSGGGEWQTNDSNYNVGIGNYVMDADGMNGALYNTAVGMSALSSLTSGARNIAVGSNAGLGLADSTDCTFIGYQAGEDVDSSGSVPHGCTYVGSYSGKNLDDGTHNTAVGFNAMIGTTGGSTCNLNVGIGKDALESIRTGDQNVVIGADAGDGTVDVDDTVIIGYGAGSGVMTDAADGTVAIGASALAGLTSGAGNVAVGFEALKVEDDGDKATAVGYQALVAQTGTTGTTANTAVGFQAGDSITTGIENTIVGAFSDTSAVGGNNQTVIGSGVTGQANNSVTLGNTSVTAVYMASDSGATVHCGQIDVENTAVTMIADTDYIGIYNNNTVTAGDSDTGNNIHGVRNNLNFNDTGESYADLTGIHNYVVSTETADEESNTIYGIRNTAQILGTHSDVANIYGALNKVDMDGGTVDANVYGIYNLIDIDGGTLSDRIQGDYLDINTTQTPAAGIRARQISLGGAGVHTSTDMFWYLYDTQNGDVVAQVTALAGVATFDSGDFSGAPDYAEYFESKSGSAIAIGSTVKLDGDKIVACSDGDTPIGVIRPKSSSAVVANCATTRYQGKYLKTDYDEIILEDYKIKEWSEEITFEEYIKRSKDETGGVLGGTVKDSKVEGVDEAPDTYFRKHSYHSDRIPEGITIADDAVELTPSHQRKKLNPDYDSSKIYKNRKERDEWCLVGLLGQIPITKGQPTGSWIKMKDVSDTVEMYFVK